MTGVTDWVISLRFFGDDLDPDEVTARLGVSPTKFNRKGQLRERESGKPFFERTGRWLLKGPKSPGTLPEQIADLLKPLNDDFSVWRDLSGRFKSDVFVGLFMQETNEGFPMEPEIMSALSSRGLTIDFDIYAPYDKADGAIE